MSAQESLLLERYTGVAVALAEGIPLDTILSTEGLSPAAWQSARIDWADRLASDGAEGPLFASFRARRAEAEDCLARPISPLDDDLATWMSFLAAFFSSADGFALLAARGLGMNDIARLQRRWDRALEQDPALKERAEELAKQGPGPLPALQVGKLELRPFPWSKRASHAATPAAPSSMDTQPAAPDDGFPLDRLAALSVELGEPGANRRQVLARGALGFEMPKNLPQARHLMDKASPGATITNAPGSLPPVVAAPKQLTMTAAADEAPPSGPALPFVGGPVSLPPVVRAPKQLTGTAAADEDATSGPALPFAGPGGTALGFELTKNLPLPRHLADKAPPPIPVKQHASLTVELEAAPERAAEILARYQISPALEAQADRYYRDRMARDAELERAWNEEHATYRAWFLAQRGNPR